MAETPFEPAGIMTPRIFGLPVARDILFSNHKNIYKKRIEKRQRRLIVKLPFLKPFLQRGEKIWLVTTGYSPLASRAQYLTGFVFVYLKRSIFVFTNYRIFHVPTTAVYKYKNSIAQIAYAGCRSILLKGGTLTVEYGGSGKIEKFRAIALAERKKIRALLQKKIPLPGTKTQLAFRTHLCPRCTHRLAPGATSCQKCRLKFKNKLAAIGSAILFPGGGYFYTRHYLVGLLTGVLELFLLVYLFFLIDDWRRQIDINLLYAAVVPAILVLEKTVTTIHAAHFVDEFIPRDKKIQPLPAA